MFPEDVEEKKEKEEVITRKIALSTATTDLPVAKIKKRSDILLPPSPLFFFFVLRK